MLKRIVLVFCVVVLSIAQVTDKDADNLRRYSATYSASLSGTAAIVTLERGSNRNDRVYIDSVQIILPTAVAVTIELDGTSPTATAGTAYALNTATASTSAFYTASDAGTGNVIHRFLARANTPETPDLAGVTLVYGGATHLTIRSAATTGAVYIVVKWGERR